MIRMINILLHETKNMSAFVFNQLHTYQPIHWGNIYYVPRIQTIMMKIIQLVPCMFVDVHALYNAYNEKLYVLHCPYFRLDIVHLPISLLQAMFNTYIYTYKTVWYLRSRNLYAQQLLFYYKSKNSTDFPAP